MGSPLTAAAPAGRSGGRRSGRRRPGTLADNMRFARYIARRLLLLPVQLLLVSLIVFFLVRQMPGEPTFLYTGPFATKERVEEVRRQLGLDQPIHVQYARYIQRVVRGTSACPFAPRSR